MYAEIDEKDRSTGQRAKDKTLYRGAGAGTIQLQLHISRYRL